MNTNTISNVKGPIIYALSYEKYMEAHRDMTEEKIREYICERIIQSGLPPEVSEIGRELGINLGIVQWKLDLMRKEKWFFLRKGKLFRKDNSIVSRFLMEYQELEVGSSIYEDLYSHIFGKELRCCFPARNTVIPGYEGRVINTLIFDLFRKPKDGDVALVWIDGKYQICSVRYNTDGHPCLYTASSEPTLIHTEGNMNARFLGVLWKVIAWTKDISKPSVEVA